MTHIGRSRQERPLPASSIRNHQVEGLAAWLEGMSHLACPFPADSPEAEAWQEGWRFGDALPAAGRATERRTLPARGRQAAPAE